MIVNAMTDFVINKLSGETAQPEYRWSAMLNPAQESVKKAPAKAKAPKATAEKKTQTIPRPRLATSLPAIPRSRLRTTIPSRCRTTQHREKQDHLHRQLSKHDPARRR